MALSAVTGAKLVARERPQSPNLSPASPGAPGAVGLAGASPRQSLYGWPAPRRGSAPATALQRQSTRVQELQEQLLNGGRARNGGEQMKVWLFLLVGLICGPVASQHPSADAAQWPTATRAVASGATRPGWRYVWYQGRWWYWTPSERWAYFDGDRWIKLDSLNQPLAAQRELVESGPKARASLGDHGRASFRFGDLASPQSRVGTFGAGGNAAAASRNLAGAFGPQGLQPSGNFSPAMPGNPPAPYGPDSAYGSYGTTNPFRAGLHIGAGGNYGYGLGSERPTIGGGMGGAANRALPDIGGTPPGPLPTGGH